MSVRVRFSAIRANSRIIHGPETYAALHEYTQSYCANFIMELVYPPPPDKPANPGTGKAYQRTYRLLRNWRLKDVSSGVGIQWQINNPAQDRWGRYYSGYVHGPSGQASFHAAWGWPNIRDKIDRPEFKKGAQLVISEVSK